MLRIALGILVIALLGACEQRQQTGLSDLPLPTVGVAATNAIPSSLHVVVRRDGQVDYDGQTVSVEAVGELVAAQVAKGERIYISAEPGITVPYPSLTELLKSLGAAGFYKIGLVTEDGKR